MTAKNSPIDLDHAAIDDLVAIGSALREAASYNHIHDTPIALIPPGWQLSLHPELRDRPARIQASVQLHTLAAYIAYLNQYARTDSATFVDLAAGTFRTVIDYHQKEAVHELNGEEDFTLWPNWCGHQALYTAPRTPEFTDWQASSGKAMTQEAFATFIEDHLPDIVEPPAAEMAEIARSLSANIQVKFAKAIRLDNGETQLQYVEEIGGSAGAKGQLKIPQTIKLGLPLFKGGDTYAVEARFRYRIKDGTLSMWYELVRIDRLIADAIEGMAMAVKEHTAPAVYFGAP